MNDDININIIENFLEKLKSGEVDTYYFAIQEGTTRISCHSIKSRGFKTFIRDSLID